MTAWLVIGHDDCATVLSREDLFAEPTGALPGADLIAGRRDLRSLVGPATRSSTGRSPTAGGRPDRPVRAVARPPARRRAPRRARPAARGWSSSTTSRRSCRSRSSPACSASRRATTRRSARRRRGSRRCSRGATPSARTRRSATRRSPATRALDPPVIDVVRARRDDPRDDTISGSGRSGATSHPTGTSRTSSTTPGSCLRGRAPRRRRCSSARPSTASSCSTATSGRRRSPTPPASPRSSRRCSGTPPSSTSAARRATGDVELGGVAIPAGERVIAIDRRGEPRPGPLAGPRPLRSRGDRAWGATSRSASGRGTASGRTSPGWRRPRRSGRSSPPSPTSTATRTRPRPPISGSCRGRGGRSTRAAHGRRGPGSHHDDGLTLDGQAIGRQPVAAARAPPALSGGSAPR